MSITLTSESYSAGPSLPFFVNSFMFEGQRVAFTVGTTFHETEEAERFCKLLNKLLELDSGQLIVDVRAVLTGTPNLVPSSPQRLIKYSMLLSAGFDITPKVLSTGQLLVDVTNSASEEWEKDTPDTENGFIKALEEYSAEFGPFSDYVSRLWQSGDI